MKKLVCILISLLFILISCSNVDLVKHGSFNSYPDVTVGEMVDAIFDDVEWEEIVATDGNDYVNMHGTLGGNSALIQFKILDDGSWIVHALEINGIPDTTYNIAQDLYTLYLNASE